ncbi:partial flavin prenyltransferase, partial [Anaerolineae bacterium]
YGTRILGELLSRGDDTAVVISPSGFLLLKEELGVECVPEDASEKLLAFISSKPWSASLKGTLSSVRHDDLMAGFASGSFLLKAMIICPCSMGTLARVATGTSGNLIERAADCMLKEKRPLVLVPRETPLNEIHLENMLRLSRMGAVILPAMPAFYTKPATVDEMVDFIAGKVLDILGVENSLYKRWKK